MPQFTVPLQGGGAMTVNASDAQAANDNAVAQGGTPSQWGGPIAGGHMMGGPGHPPTGPSTPSGGTPQGDGGGLDAILQALQRGDQRDFDEKVRQFAQTYGLDVRKFEEDVRQYNQNFGLNQAAVTGTYQGAPTLPALTSYATQFGQWGVPQQGQSTLAAQNQAYTQQMGAISAAAAAQANPFRQQQVIGQLGGLLGGQGVAGFSAPNTVAGVGTAGGNTRGGMGYLSQLIADIKDPVPNQTSMSQVLNAIPTPNKLNSVEFQRAAPSTQSMVLQGMQEKFGLNPDDALKQINATLPQFTAPTMAGSVRR